MLLSIDIGNTNIDFGLFKGEELCSSFSCYCDLSRTFDEHIVWLDNMLSLRGYKRSEVSGAILSSVVPALDSCIEKICSDYFSCSLYKLDHKVLESIISPQIKFPEEIGSDRLANSIYLIERASLPAILIDFGTATTFDIVDVRGLYIGGIISPGVSSSIKSLHADTARLPIVDLAKDSILIGRSTVEAMRSGLLWGYVSMVEGLIKRIDKFLGKKTTVTATGGFAALIYEHLGLIDDYNEHATLMGLRMVYDRYYRKS